MGIVFFSNSMLHVFSQHVVNTKYEKNVNWQFLEMFRRDFGSAFVVLCVVIQWSYLEMKTNTAPEP